MPLPERNLIERIRRSAGKPSRNVRLGIGDDAAVLTAPAGHELLVTTDLSLEGTHFRREWHPPEAIGHRCLARGLSDIAAMGGQPIAAFLSLALPTDLPQKWVHGFFRGFHRLARRFRVTLAGGDIASSASGVIADIVVLGSVPKQRAVLRSGARPGDIIYVTGALGGAAAGLGRLASDPRLARKSIARTWGTIGRHLYPEPRVEVGRWLRERKLATAMIDLSDGLSTDLSHICEESGVGAILNQPLIPMARGATPDQALHGGEDYELLFTTRPAAKLPIEIAGVAVTEIGWVTKGKQVLITDVKSKPRVLRAQGWEHFSR